MGFRVYRRKKIGPGLTLNISKSGPSLTMGRRGAKVTIGSRGTRTTVGLPGTGVYYTKAQRWRTGRQAARGQRRVPTPSHLAAVNDQAFTLGFVHQQLEQLTPRLEVEDRTGMIGAHLILQALASTLGDVLESARSTQMPASMNDFHQRWVAAIATRLECLRWMTRALDTFEDMRDVDRRALLARGIEQYLHARPLFQEAFRLMPKRRRQWRESLSSVAAAVMLGFCVIWYLIQLVF